MVVVPSVKDASVVFVPEVGIFQLLWLVKSSVTFGVSSAHALPLPAIRAHSRSNDLVNKVSFCLIIEKSKVNNVS